jgi:hypothetical protein
MAKSSISSGEALSFSAELIKALSPVIKRATPAQVDRLKKNPRLLQEALGDLLGGNYPVKDWGALVEDVVEIQFENRTGLKLRPDLRFDVSTEQTGDGYAVRIHADSDDDLYLFEVEFEKLFLEINERKDLLVSINSLHATLENVGSTQSAYAEAIQSANAEYISKHGKFEIAKWNESVDGEVMFSLTCGKYEETLQLTPDQIMKMIAKRQ